MPDPKAGRPLSCARMALAIGCAALAACSANSTADGAADASAIRAVSLAWKRAFNAGDAAAVTALYAEDAVLSAPGVPLVRSRAAIAEYFQKTGAQFANAGLTVADAPLGNPVASGDLGFQWETYSVTNKAGTVVDSGRLLTLFRRHGGKWLIVADTWNSDAAPATQAGGPETSPH
jgi:uncharacterized protein (TIGR02246 family)